MPISPEDFQQRIKKIVQDHYVSTPTPLLLAHLGSQIEKEDLWPTDRGQRSLKQLIADTCSPELAVVFDRRSPAYVAVVTQEVRAAVEALIAEKLGEKDTPPVRVEELARPFLLAFCIDVKNQPVYVRRMRPFRYEIGHVQADKATEYVVVEPEFRRPGLRIDNPHLLSISQRRDLENLIQKWAIVHSLDVSQFSRIEDEKETLDTSRTALDRLMAAQEPDVAQRLILPADIALILAKMR
jgi:hypothetical protein